MAVLTASQPVPEGPQMHVYSLLCQHKHLHTKQPDHHRQGALPQAPPAAARPPRLLSCCPALRLISLFWF